jgi:hypothetical protein
MIAAPVQGDVDGIAERSHSGQYTCCELQIKKAKLKIGGGERLIDSVCLLGAKQRVENMIISMGDPSTCGFIAAP